MANESQPVIIRRNEALPTVAVTQTAHDNTAALVYLARLAPGSRRTMRAALDYIAGLLTKGREGCNHACVGSVALRAYGGDPRSAF